MKNLYDSSTYTSFMSTFPKVRVSIETPNITPPIYRSWNFFRQKASFHSFQAAAVAMKERKNGGDRGAREEINNLVGDFGGQVVGNLVEELSTQGENMLVDEVSNSVQSDSGQSEPFANAQPSNTIHGQSNPPQPSKSFVQIQDQLLMEQGAQIPIIIFSGLYCTSESFYEVLLALSAKGLQVVVTDIPIVDSLEELALQFEAFCNKLGFEKVHLMGAECGSFIAQYIADKKPELIASICLINPFVTNAHLVELNIFPEILVSLAPGFLLRRILKATIPKQTIKATIENPDIITTKKLDESDIPDLMEDESLASKIKIKNSRVVKSVNFVKYLLESTPAKELASKVNLLTRKVYKVEPLFIDEELITIIETLDQKMLFKEILELTKETYPNARYATIKDGGDFPQLGNSKEVIMHILLHLRRATQNIFGSQEEFSASGYEDSYIGVHVGGRENLVEIDDEGEQTTENTEVHGTDNVNQVDNVNNI